MGAIARASSLLLIVQHELLYDTLASMHNIRYDSPHGEFAREDHGR